jgi:molybdopterin converting factor small subunit
MISVRILYFAAARDITGLTEELVQFQIESIPLCDVLESLFAQHKGLREIWSRSLTSVNIELVDNDIANIMINDGDEIAIIPPVSGG